MWINGSVRVSAEKGGMESRWVGQGSSRDKNRKLLEAGRTIAAAVWMLRWTRFPQRRSENSSSTRRRQQAGLQSKGQHLTLANKVQVLAVCGVRHDASRDSSGGPVGQEPPSVPG